MFKGGEHLLGATGSAAWLAEKLTQKKNTSQFFMELETYIYIIYMNI